MGFTATIRQRSSPVCHHREGIIEIRSLIVTHGTRLTEEAPVVWVKKGEKVNSKIARHSFDQLSMLIAQRIRVLTYVEISGRSFLYPSHPRESRKEMLVMRLKARFYFGARGFSSVPSRAKKVNLHKFNKKISFL